MLGLPFSHPLDMWGVGQILLFLFNPQTMCNCSSYQNMRHLIDLLGQPPDHVLNAGRYTSKYFVKVANHFGSSWRLKVSSCSARFDDGFIPHYLETNKPTKIHFTMEQDV
ncbi:unnamed protein product [Tetraodon nigroviridis]|uniref:(spotted green pufferfish) hypothetical protein n=1 Tax=Tetraodon nigroviridis TaxID=99883 RepID=Q4S770_TETNG|nr:unnamed protein product [Tetraodon nigroviridis]